MTPAARIGRALVTGGAGFIGRHLIARLASLGVSVTAPCRADGFDLLRDELSLDGIDHVFHLAARTGIVQAWEGPVDFYWVNTHGTVRVLDQCRRHGCPMTFVSAYVYGQPERLPIREDDPVNSNNPYAVSKLMAEEACRFYTRFCDVAVSVLRPFNVYGPGQSERFLLPHIVRQLLDPACAEIQVMDLVPRRDYVFVSDTIDAILAATEAPPGSLFNIGSGESYSVEEVIRLAGRLAGIDKPYRAIGKRRPNEVDDVVADTSAIHDALGWRPRIPIEDGLRQLIESMRQP